MRQYLENGWYIKHITDRTVLLVKEHYGYRYFTERDGYVFVRGEPEMSRREIVDKALVLARRNDEKLAMMIGKQLVPTKFQLAAYIGKQVQMKQVFATPEDPAIIGIKSP